MDKRDRLETWAGGGRQEGDRDRGGDKGETCTRGRKGRRWDKAEIEETKIRERQRGTEKASEAGMETENTGKRHGWEEGL